jgi:hypothetical protein
MLDQAAQTGLRPSNRRTGDTAQRMSQQDVEVVRWVGEAFDRGDLVAFCAFVHSEIVLEYRGVLLHEAATYSGAVSEMCELMFQAFDDWRVEIEERRTTAPVAMRN